MRINNQLIDFNGSCSNASKFLSSLLMNTLESFCILIDLIHCDFCIGDRNEWHINVNECSIVI